jgi:hypothetical protein
MGKTTATQQGCKRDRKHLLLTGVCRRQNFKVFQQSFFERLKRERKRDQNTCLTCGKRGDMWGYLSEVARCQKMPSKSTFWAAKPVKKRKKEKGKGADAVNGGG